MKKTFKYFLILLFAASLINLNAQDDAKVSITPLVGWQFGGSVRFVNADLNIDDNVNYGGILSVKVAYETFVEVSYSLMSTSADLRSFTPHIESRTFDLDVHYIMIGGLREFTDTKVRPFGKFSIGAAGFVPKDLPGASSSWSFSISLGAGAKYMITPHIGLRLQGRLLMPLRFNGFGIYAGTGGVGGAAYSTVNILQGDFQFGLIIAF